MKKLMTALVAGLMTLAFAGAYAADDAAKTEKTPKAMKGDKSAMKSETGDMKSQKGMAMKDAKSKKGSTDTTSTPK